MLSPSPLAEKHFAYQSAILAAITSLALLGGLPKRQIRRIAVQAA